METTAVHKSEIPAKIRDGYTLMLRTCIRDESGALTSYDGFTWPEIGPVECPPPHADFPLRHWDPDPQCGNGLHGFLRGTGDASLANRGHESVWLVVEVKSDEVVDLEGKIKVPRGHVLFSGERLRALEIMAKLGHLDDGHIFGIVTAGDYGTATAGDYGTATAGNDGTATAGNGGTATAGYGGTATAGDRGTATAGDRGTATAGDHGIMQIKWWDGNRNRISTAYVGEDGIIPGSKYMLDVAGKFILVQQVE